VNTAIDSLIASWRTMVGPTIFGVEWPLPEGSLTFLACAQRLYEFPLGVFGIAVATAIFPAMARESHDREAFLATLRRGLRLTVFIGLPASAGLVALRSPLSATLFQGGHFTAEDASMVAWVLLGYAPAIWAYSIQQVATRAFYALGDATTPMRVALAMVALNLVLNLVLIWTPLGVAGLAWSTGITAIVQVTIILRLLARRTGTIIDRDVRSSWTKSLVCAIATGAAIVAALFVVDASGIAGLAGTAGTAAAADFGGQSTPPTWAHAAVSLLVGTCAGVGAVAICARVLKLEEFGWVLLGRRAASSRPDR